jgi:hypothetical protein
MGSTNFTPPPPPSKKTRAHVCLRDYSTMLDQNYSNVAEEKNCEAISDGAE